MSITLAKEWVKVSLLRHISSKLSLFRFFLIPAGSPIINNVSLIDAIDVIVHIFHHEQRKNYELEKMWADIIPNQKIFI